METEVREFLTAFERKITAGITLMGGRFDSLDRKVDSLERRVGGLERESAHTAALFGEVGESLANIHEQIGNLNRQLNERMGRLEDQLGRNNARLERLTAMFMASKTESIVRYGRIEQRLVDLEERLRPANDPRGSDA